MEELTKWNGIGNLSAKMLLTFCFNKQDIVTVEDLFFIKNYNTL